MSQEPKEETLSETCRQTSDKSQSVEPTDDEVNAAIDALAEKAMRGVVGGSSGHAWAAHSRIRQQAELLKRVLNTPASPAPGRRD